MDLRRLRAGEWVAAVSGAVLLASLFLPWYGAGDEDASAWEALAVIDVVLALLAAFAVALLPITAAQRTPAVPIALAAFVALAGLIAVVLLLVRLGSVPGGFEGREWGLWVGLAGALGIAAGGSIAMQDERLSPAGRHTDLTGRPVPPPPEIEPIAAPRPE